MSKMQIFVCWNLADENNFSQTYKSLKTRLVVTTGCDWTDPLFSGIWMVFIMKHKLCDFLSFCVVMLSSLHAVRLTCVGIRLRTWRRPARSKLTNPINKYLKCAWRDPSNTSKQWLQAATFSPRSRLKTNICIKIPPQAESQSYINRWKQTEMSLTELQPCSAETWWFSFI